MQLLSGIWIFYRKLIIPTLFAAIAIGAIIMGVSGSFYVKPIGVGYIFLTPVFHYFIYEVRNPGEYYFYYNMGLTKGFLWIMSVLLSAFIGLLIILL